MAQFSLYFLMDIEKTRLQQSILFNLNFILLLHVINICSL